MLVKAGCFSGACHGAGAGKNGFKLSLLGYDPELDYEAMIYQLRGRRVNFVRPEESLLLKKPTMQQVHLGGERFTKDSETYRTVLAWIRGGAPYESTKPRRITGPDRHSSRGSGGISREQAAVEGGGIVFGWFPG